MIILFVQNADTVDNRFSADIEDAVGNTFTADIGDTTDDDLVQILKMQLIIY